MTQQARQRTDSERLDEIERLLAELVQRKRRAARGGRRRSATVAERAAAKAVATYTPTDLQVAAARRRLRGLG